MVMLLGLELRHHSLRHVLALLLTFALASLCWCCWKRHRSFHRHRRDLLLHHHHQRAAAAPAAVSSSSSAVSPASAAVSVLPPAAVIPPLPFRRFRPVSAVSFPPDPGPGPGPGPENSEEQLDPLIKNSDCPICLCAFETDVLLVVLPSCDHAYHPSCIHRWLQSHTDCPICRSEIPHL